MAEMIEQSPEQAQANADTNPQTLAEIQALTQCPEVLAVAKVVGAWIWAEFAEKPSDEVRAFLKARGYRFNPKRKVWQNPCGIHSRKAPYDPRDKYGVKAVADLV